MDAATAELHDAFVVWWRELDMYTRAWKAAPSDAEMQSSAIVRTPHDAVLIANMETARVRTMAALDRCNTADARFAAAGIASNLSDLEIQAIRDPLTNWNTAVRLQRENAGK
jgi:hypothetical protein